MKYFYGKYTNGYMDCDEYWFFQISSEDKLDKIEYIMNLGLPEYISEYEYIAREEYCEYNEDDEEFYESQEYENYLSGCYYEIHEVTKEDAEENFGVSDKNWICL